MISWNKPIKNKEIYLADIGDLRLRLQQYRDNWLLSLSIKVYTTDKTQSMYRPYIAITKYPCTYSVEDAIQFSTEYIKEFVFVISQSL